MTATTPLPERVLAGRYALQNEIAAGGVGRVHRAEDRLLHRQVAVKVLRSEVAASPSALQRFRREARAAAALQHPNIAAVLDFGEDDGVPFLVMEYVPGLTLAQRLAGGPLTPAEAMAVARGIADGLAHAHARGVVHRDVKPANVLLAPDGTPKVTDFGIARVVDDPTTTGPLMGTPCYLAPEQALGGAVGPASDLYSLGAVLYEMLSGRPPFDDPDPMVVVARHLHATVPPLHTPGLPPAVSRLVSTLLAKDPYQRPADAAAVARLLRQAEHQPVTTQPTRAPAATRAMPAPRSTAVMPPPPTIPARRRRGWLRAAVIVGLCLLLVVLGWILAAAAFSSPPATGIAVGASRAMSLGSPGGALR